MCGIAGFNWKDRELGEKMNSCMIHRGPDAGGVFADDGITLGNRRLAVIDLSESANQPMQSVSGDLTIVYNGEIYNYKELRSELADYKFRTESDTEVILAGFDKWGKGVVDKLNGIFAFAIWDRRDKSLFCVRDHMGVKPFYYYRNGGKFIFASEIKSIFAHEIPRTLNVDAFNRYMRVLYSPEPDTMIENVFKLPSGSHLTLAGGELRIAKYYEPAAKPEERPYPEALKILRQSVEEAVKRQMVADVPVGVYLSGGIDSSAVLASAVGVSPHIKTFSIGFDLTEGEEAEKFNRDFELARQSAEHFGAEHHPLRVSAKDVADNLEEVIGSMDDPVSNPTAVPMALLSRFARNLVTVVLSGNGGDELFGGYERYRMSRRVDMVAAIPFIKHLLPRKIRKAADMTALERLVQFEFEKDARLSKVLTNPLPNSEIQKYFAKYISAGDKTEALMLADLRSWLPDQALMLGDKMSMRGSLEERVPLLDRKLVDFAMSLPLGFKVTPFATKKILKDAFRDALPKGLLREPKRGWFSPGAKWLRRPEILSIAREVLSERYHRPISELFDWPAVRSMLENHVSKKEYNLTVLWAILTFQIWAKRYKISVS